MQLNYGIIRMALFSLGEFFVVVEYCVNGDLYNYVKKNRIDLSARFGRKESGTSIQYFTRLRIAFDIANGMNYLSTKGVSLSIFIYLFITTLPNTDIQHSTITDKSPQNYIGRVTTTV